MRARGALAAVLILSLAAAACAEETEPSSDKKPPSSEEIAALIADLDSDSYQTREAATRSLIEIGGPAVKPLSEAAATGSLEVGVRAVRVLEALYTGKNSAEVSAAEGALETLAGSNSRSIAGRAEQVFSLHQDVARRVAIAKIRSLGGIPKYYDSKFEAQPVVPDPPQGEDEQPVEILILGNDWKGGEEGLKYVKRLPNLNQLLVVRGIGISEKALGDLQSVLPNLRIETRGPAYLGVSMTPTPAGCQVNQVSPNSAAQKAGIRAKDTILQFGDVTVTKPEDIIEAIKTMKPGDKVKVLVERGGRTQILDVVMGGWSG